MDREQILKIYADFAQVEQDESIKAGWNLTNNILVRPLINLFNGEHGALDWRKFITQTAQDKDRAGSVRLVILDSVEYFRGINGEALLTINGERVVKPSYIQAKYVAHKQNM